MGKKIKKTQGMSAPNYTQIPNQFLGDPIRGGWRNGMIAEMKGTHVKVMLVLFRITFGFHRSSARLSIRKIAGAAGVSVQTAQEAVLEAERMGSVIRFNDGGVLVWQVNAPWLRSDWFCTHCGTRHIDDGQEPHRHHIVPRAHGGKDRPSNMITLCPVCHRKVHQIIENMLKTAEPSEDLFREALRRVLEVNIPKPRPAAPHAPDYALVTGVLESSTGVPKSSTGVPDSSTGVLKSSTPSKKESTKETPKEITKNPASGGDAADNGQPLYQIVDVADLVDAAPDVPHTELAASCENCGAIMERDADCPDCGTPTFWKLGKLTGRQKDAIKKLEKPDLLVAPGDELGRRAARLWSDGAYWRSASQRATFRKLLKVKERGWFLQILSWAEGKRGITFASFKKALNNPVQYQKWEDRQQSRPDAEGYAERRQAQDDAALADAQAKASRSEPVDLEAMGIITR